MSDLNREDFSDLSPQFQQYTATVVYLTLFEYFLVCLLSLIAIPIFLRFLWIAFHNRIHLSAQLQINICVWLCHMLLAIIYAAPMLIYWRGNGVEFDTLSLRVRGALNFGATMATPLSTFFLTFSRLYSVSFTTLKKHSTRHLVLHCASVLVLGVVFSLVGDTVFRRSYRNKTTTTCITFGCLLPGQLKDIVTLNIAISLLNIVIGSAFAFVHYLYGRESPMREKRKNYVVLFLLLVELVFNIVPILFNLAFGGVILPFTTGNLGPILTTTHTFDGFATALVYLYMWRKQTIKFNVQVFKISSNTQQSRTSLSNGIKNMC